MEDSLKNLECEEFAQNFAIELTNRNLFEREEIGRKYFKQLQREKQNAQDTYEMYKALMDSFNILQKKLEEEKSKKEKYKQALEEIKGISETCLDGSDPCFNCKYCEDCLLEDEEVPTYNPCKIFFKKCEVLKDD